MYVSTTAYVDVCYRCPRSPEEGAGSLGDGLQVVVSRLI